MKAIRCNHHRFTDHLPVRIPPYRRGSRRQPELFIKEQYSQRYVQIKNEQSKKMAAIQDAHEAIRTPHDIALTPTVVKGVPAARSVPLVSADLAQEAFYRQPYGQRCVYDHHCEDHGGRTQLHHRGFPPAFRRFHVGLR